MITEHTNRVGIGYDVHKLVKNRLLIVGGVTIDYELGALGHSDADVLIHAIADALLGAAAMGDIGQHFPDTDEKNRGLSGSVLLAEVVRLLNSNHYSIVNVDSKMRENLSRILKIDINRVSVKATTTEKLGFVGRNEGIAAEAIVLLNNNA